MMLLSSLLGLLLLIVVSVSGISYRCFSCRSRGDLGDCRDISFYNNDTSSDHNRDRGVTIIPCRSGWCSKSMEGIREGRDEFGTRTERSCLTNPPHDNEERCAEILLSSKPSRICFCRGDLCNEGNSLSALVPFLVFPVLALFF